ncbi:MAG: hypothetical protein HGA54_09165, partial [Actinobacteria bacterium]|nr:hypothetical protein [Actinomycetota bacterium]
MKSRRKILACIVTLMFMWLLAPSIAFGVAGNTYTRATTINSGSTYLLVSNIYALDRSSGTWYTNNTGSSALTALSQAQRFDLLADFGNRNFTVNGTTLTETAPTFADDTIDARYTYTITSAGVSDGTNPGYHIKRGSSFLNLYQTWTGLTYATEPIALGTGGQSVSRMATVTDPVTSLSSTARVWYWNGANFYTRYTSDLTSIGQLIPPGNGFWSGSYLLSTSDGWAWINWDAINIRSYQNETFYLTGAYTSGGGFYDFALPTIFHPEMTYITQYGYRGSALFASASPSAYTFDNAYGHGFQISPLSLYKLNQTYTGSTVNVRLDGYPSSIQAGSTVALYQSGSSNYSGTIATGAASFTFSSPVLEGTYDVYIGGSDTDTNIVVNANAASVMVDY